MKQEFDVSSYVGKIKKSSSSYFYTFINRESLAAGILYLEPGQEDTQEPHENDEIYYVITGDGFLNINNKDYEVSKDKVFFVGKNIPHHFHGNKKILKVLYFFGGPDID